MVVLILGDLEEFGRRLADENPLVSLHVHVNFFFFLCCKKLEYVEKTNHNPLHYFWVQNGLIFALEIEHLDNFLVIRADDLLILTADFITFPRIRAVWCPPRLGQLDTIFAIMADLFSLMIRAAWNTFRHWGWDHDRLIRVSRLGQLDIRLHTKAAWYLATFGQLDNRCGIRPTRLEITANLSD